MSSAKDKWGNSAKLGPNLGKLGYPVIMNGNATNARLVDLYLEGGKWSGTNALLNKYCYNGNTKSWAYIGKGTITSNYSDYVRPVEPSSVKALPEVILTSQSAKYSPGATIKAGSAFNPGEAPASPTPAGLGGTITFGDQPTELLRYGGWILIAIVAIFYFLRPKKRRR